MQIDLRVLELLSSKICHDLISPVSAINNGVELIEDIGGSVVDEAMKLIGDSAVQASRKLRVFRIAYGRAGSEENLPLRDVRLVAQQYFTGGKIKLLWDDSLALGATAAARGALKVLVNMLIMTEEMLAYGGEIKVCAIGEEGSGGTRLEIRGRNIHVSQAFGEALSQETAVENLTPRTVQPYMTGLFASRFALQIKPDSFEEDRLDLSLVKEKSEYDGQQDV